MDKTQIIEIKKDICNNVDKIIEILDKRFVDLTSQEMDEVKWLGEFLKLEERWKEIHK